MRFAVALIVGLLVFSGISAAAYLASAQGWGLQGMLDRPVSVRQQSTTAGTGRSGPMFLYFSTRRHYGGGFRGGK